MPVYCDPAREQQRQLAGRLAGGRMADRRRQGLRFATQVLHGNVELRTQVGDVPGHHGQGFTPGLPALGQARGQVAQRDVLRIGQLRLQLDDARQQRVAIRGVPRQQFRRPLPGRGRRTQPLAVFAPVFLQRDVEVGAAESEGADRCASRRTVGCRQPRLRFVVQVQRAVVLAQDRVGIGNVSMRGQHAVVQRQRCLHQAADASRSLGVPDQRLDRADRGLARLATGLGDQACGAFQFGGVAGDGAGAMRLEQFHVARAEPGLRVGAAHCPHCPAGRGAVRPLA